MLVYRSLLSPCAGELEGGQIGNLMELCDTTAPSIFYELGVGAMCPPGGTTRSEQHIAKWTCHMCSSSINLLARQLSGSRRLSLTNVHFTAVEPGMASEPPHRESRPTLRQIRGPPNHPPSAPQQAHENRGGQMAAPVAPIQFSARPRTPERNHAAPTSRRIICGRAWYMLP